MHARTPTFRTPAAPAATWRTRMAVAVGRRFGARHATPTAPVTPMTPMTPMLSEPRSAERFERMELDQRVREIGEW